MYVRAKVFANAVMATDEIMQREAEHWIQDAGGVLPPGNGVDAKLWSPKAASSLDDSDKNSTTVDSGNIVSPFSQAQVTLPSTCIESLCCQGM